MKEYFDCPRLMIAGISSGSGKTTAMMAVNLLLHRHDYLCTCFKNGPDFIDGGFHSRLSGNPCYNLDTWMMEEKQVKKLLTRTGENKIALIEGAMGLYDGAPGGREQGSSAHLARVLDCPVILVIDGKGMAGSAAAIVQGFQLFDPRVKVAGVIFNRVNSHRHYEILKSAVEQNTGVISCGYLPFIQGVSFSSRHLGLVQAEEEQDWEKKLQALEELLPGLEVEKIVNLASQAGKMKFEKNSGTAFDDKYYNCLAGKKVAIARDNAFAFIYEHSLEAMRHMGCELSFFSPLAGEGPSSRAQLVFFPGGYPELYAKELASSSAWQKGLYRHIENGAAVYAECGGMLVLGKSLKDKNGQEWPMSGVMPFFSQMEQKRVALGYVNILCQQDNLWGNKGEQIRGHEFHYSRLEVDPRQADMATVVLKKPSQETGRLDGYQRDKVLAGYAHIPWHVFPQALLKMLQA